MDAIVLVGDGVEFDGNEKDTYTDFWSDMRTRVTALLTQLIPAHVGDALGIIEGIEGRGLITKEELSLIDRALAFICLREVKSVFKIGKLIKTSIKLSKYSDEALYLARNFGDDFLIPLTKHGDDFALAYKNSKLKGSFVEIVKKYTAKSDDLGEKVAAAITRHGDDAIKIIKEYSDDAVEAIAKHNDDAVYLIKEFGGCSQGFKGNGYNYTKMASRSFAEQRIQYF